MRQRFRRTALATFGLCLSSLWRGSSGVHAQTTVILYKNDFENPNVPLEVNCGNSLDNRGINELYGHADFQFQQTDTVEAVFLHDPGELYTTPASPRDHGDYAVGMLSTVQDDKLGLAFDSQGYPFINVGLDLSSIEVQDCGGPFGVATPRLRISLLDRPDGTVDLYQKVLDSQEVVGTTAPDAWTFAWSTSVVGLNTEGSTNGDVTIVFDMLESGYAVFDNLSITASMQSKVVDLDLDGEPDDQDNCPTVHNDDQSNLDGDLAGDACDPAPQDESQCGDIDGDALDDCNGSPVMDAGVSPYANPDGTQADAGGSPASAGDAGSNVEPNMDGALSSADAASGCSCNASRTGTGTGTGTASNSDLEALACMLGGFVLLRRRTQRQPRPRRKRASR